MSDSWHSYQRRLLELLADEALFGLTADGREELDSLVAIMPDFDLLCMERVSAAVHLAHVSKHLEPLPESLDERIRVGAAQFQMTTSGE